MLAYEVTVISRLLFEISGRLLHFVLDENREKVVTTIDYRWLPAHAKLFMSSFKVIALTIFQARYFLLFGMNQGVVNFEYIR